MLLNGAYLVETERVDGLRDLAAELEEHHASSARARADRAVAALQLRPGGAHRARMTTTLAERDVALVDLVDRLLGGGVVIAGDITLAVADVDLVYVSLRALVSSVATAQEKGLLPPSGTRCDRALRDHRQPTPAAAGLAGLQPSRPTAGGASARHERGRAGRRGALAPRGGGRGADGGSRPAAGALRHARRRRGACASASRPPRRARRALDRVRGAVELSVRVARSATTAAETPAGSSRLPGQGSARARPPGRPRVHGRSRARARERDPARGRRAVPRGVLVDRGAVGSFVAAVGRLQGANSRLRILCTGRGRPTASRADERQDPPRAARPRPVRARDRPAWTTPSRRRINADPENVQRGLAQLVLTIVELLRQLMERQALRRVDGGGPTEDQVERLGRTFMELDQRMAELCEEFGLDRGGPEPRPRPARPAVMRR